MKKILISVLGKGQYDKSKCGFDYKVTNYQLENEKPIQSKLVSDVLHKIMNFDKIYIVGTNESLWDIADQYIEQYEKIIVPYGKNSEEFWEIFTILTRLDIDDAEVHVDVTHGFRSLPIFISTILNFFTKVKNAKIKGVYYGIFEARDQERDITPVINILPLLEMNQVIDAYHIFQKYSDGRDFAEFINEKFKEIPNEQKRDYGTIQQFAKDLDFYSKTVGFSAVRPYFDILDKIDSHLKSLDKIPSNLKALEYVIENMEKEVEIYQDCRTTWSKHLALAKHLFKKNRYAQSLTILRETLLTYILEELDINVMDENLREEKLGNLLKQDNDVIRNHKEPRYFTKDFIQLTDQVKNLRNKANHAFIAKDSGEKAIKKSIENLQEYLNKFSELIDNNKIFLDKDAIKDSLSQ